MRSGVWWLLLVARLAAADDGSLHVRMPAEQDSEPLLHIDPTLIDPSLGSVSETQGVALSLGPHARLAAQGTSWVSGLSPDEAIDIRDHGFQGAAELSYDVGPFSIGANVSLTRDTYGTRRTVGLFAFKRFNLSRWMHAWIAIGLSFDQYDRYDDTRGALRSGTTLGISLGTTFR